MSNITKNLEEAKKIVEYLEASNVGLEIASIEVGKHSVLVSVGVPCHSSIKGWTYETEKVWSIERAISLVNSMR